MPAAWTSNKGAFVLKGSYEEAVKMMGGMDFMGRLLNFAKDTINDETVELLQPYFNAPDFNFDAAKKVTKYSIC
jgi:dynein heavy chain